MTEKEYLQLGNFAKLSLISKILRSLDIDENVTLKKRKELIIKTEQLANNYSFEIKND